MGKALNAAKVVSVLVTNDVFDKMLESADTVALRERAENELPTERAENVLVFTGLDGREEGPSKLF